MKFRFSIMNIRSNKAGPFLSNQPWRVNINVFFIFGFSLENEIASLNVFKPGRVENDVTETSPLIYEKLAIC